MCRATRGNPTRHQRNGSEQRSHHDEGRGVFDTEGVLTMSVTAVSGDWDDFHTRALESPVPNR